MTRACFPPCLSKLTAGDCGPCNPEQVCTATQHAHHSLAPCARGRTSTAMPAKQSDCESTDLEVSAPAPRPRPRSPKKVRPRVFCFGGQRTCTASTTMLAKKSDSESTILDDSAVLAQLISTSLPSVSVLMARCSSMNLHACRRRALSPGRLSLCVQGPEHLQRPRPPKAPKLPPLCRALPRVCRASWRTRQGCQPGAALAQQCAVNG